MSDGLQPVRAIAKQLSCSQETVRRMLRKNEIPGCKVGREWRADPEQVILALSQSAQPSATQCD